MKNLKCHHLAMVLTVFELMEPFITDQVHYILLTVIKESSHNFIFLTRMKLLLNENKGCDPDLMQELSRVMATVHPFADACKMLFEVEQESIADAKYNGEQPAQVPLAIIQDRKNDKRRYNAPRSNEVSIIFQNADGEPPSQKVSFKIETF